MSKTATADASELRLLYDRKTAARMTSISVRSLDYLISSGELKVRRIGTRILVAHAELVRFAGRDHVGTVAAA
ncbi:helix-turn-helix domain-containing protein [Edaphobacter sp. HDX4]|uniref:helix-turn-helix domain-containing protein n=1 Tax=Edaphobacter sp. HDX4 TaxID=2794064 RepID=UPI002FE5F53E